MLAMVTKGAPLAACGNCGSDQVRSRVRGSCGSRLTAQVVCIRCGAHGQLYVGTDAPDLAAKDWAHRPHSVPAQSVERLPHGRLRAPEPTLQRDTLELIARMLVGGSFREPSDGRSTLQPLTSADIAGAVGLMRDPVAKRAVVVVALQGQAVSLASLGRSLARRVMLQIQWDRRSGAKPALRMDDPADRWRMRLVLQDAVNDLVWPERKVTAHEAAKAAKMRKGVYLSVYSIATASLQQALEDGRQEFKGRLFARD
ncbi:hypothetical protein [Stenotrophomonas pavanii]|uniref:hypothetical protein n=1 Tax=Stenotrophomonas pavanii TaxID=487698 RepID=UPI0039C5DC06